MGDANRRNESFPACVMTFDLDRLMETLQTANLLPRSGEPRKALPAQSDAIDVFPSTTTTDPTPPANWSKPTSKSQAAIYLGISADTIDDRLRIHPNAVQRVSRQLWKFDKNDPLFASLP